MTWFKRFFNPVHVPAGDTTPPTTPGGLSASAANPSVISLATLSTDNVAVTGYSLERKLGSGAYSVIQAAITSWPYTDASVAISTTYSYRTRAFDLAGNFSAYSNVSTVTIPSGALAPDTTPPLTPGSAPTLVQNGTTTAVISLPYVNDSTVNSGTQVVSGMKQYLVKVNGVVTGSPVPQGATSLTFGAGVDIGTPSPEGTDSVASGVYTLSCGGVLWGGTSDQMHLLAGQVAGDFDFVARVASTGAAIGTGYAKAGIVVRDGTDPAAPYMACIMAPGVPGATAEFRTNAGISAGWNGAVLSHSAPYYFRINRTGNVFTAYMSATNGSWGTAVTSQTIVMGTSVTVGLGISALNATFDNVTFTAATAATATLSFPGSTTPVSQSVTYAGVDNVGNVGAYSPALTFTPTALGSSTTVKWHPGHYADQDSTGTTLGNSQLAAKRSDIAIVRGGPAQVLGYQVAYFWPCFENSTAGAYDFSYIDRDYVQLTTGSTSWNPGDPFPGYSSPRRLAIWLVVEDYFNSNPTASVAIPAYIAASSAYGPGYNGVQFGYWGINGSGGAGTGCIPAIWRSSVMSRLTALMYAMAAHVLPDGTTVDTSPYTEWVAPYAESAAGPSPATDPTYSTTTFNTLLQNLHVAMGPVGPGVAFPHTNVFGMINFGPGTEVPTQNLVLSLPTSGTGRGGSDLFGYSSGQNACPGLCGLTWGQMSSAGFKPLSNSGAAGAPWASTGGTNLKGVIPIMDIASGSELGLYYTPQDEFNQAQVVGDTHLAWTLQTSGMGNGANWWGTATSQAQWNANPAAFGGTLYVITTNTLSNTAYPSSY